MDGHKLWAVAMPKKFTGEALHANNAVYDFDLPALGDVVCAWLYHGSYRPHFFTSDGLYVGTLFEDTARQRLDGEPRCADQPIRRHLHGQRRAGAGCVVERVGQVLLPSAGRATRGGQRRGISRSTFSRFAASRRGRRAVSRPRTGSHKPLPGVRFARTKLA